MANGERRVHSTEAITSIDIVTQLRERDTMFGKPAGWYWWWSAKDPEGNDLVSVCKGPLASEDQCLADAGVRGGI